MTQEAEANKATSRSARSMRERYAFFTRRTWLLGAAVALVGVALARFAPSLCAAPASGWLELAGRLLAILGLFVIAYGIHRNMRNA